MSSPHFSKTIISHILSSPQISHILLHFLSPAHLFLDPSPPHSILGLLYISWTYQTLSSTLGPLKCPFPLIGMLHTLIFSRLVPSCFPCLLFQLRFSERLSLWSKDAPNSVTLLHNYLFYCLSSTYQYLILSIYFSPVSTRIKLHDSVTLPALPTWFTSVSSTPKSEPWVLRLG